MKRFGQQRNGTFIVQKVKLPKEEQIRRLEEKLSNVLNKNYSVQKQVDRGKEAEKVLKLNRLQAEEIMKELLKLRGEEYED